MDAGCLVESNFRARWTKLGPRYEQLHLRAVNFHHQKIRAISIEVRAANRPETLAGLLV